MGVILLVSCVVPFSDDAMGWSGEIAISLSKRFSRTMNLISLRGDNGWPARSPDLTLCDFFSLGVT
jgi:hypothetical protein